MFARAACLLCLAATVSCADAAAPAEPVPDIIDTGDPSIPWIINGKDGNVYWLHADPGSGSPNGISVATPDGQEGHLAIDPVTAAPLYWSAGGWVVAFGNWRLAEGLVDATLISPAGDSELMADLSYPVYEPTAAAGSFVLLTLDDVKDFFTKASAAAGTTLCLASVFKALVGTTAALATVPPAVVPLLATSSTEIALSCATAGLSLASFVSDDPVIQDGATGGSLLSIASYVKDCAKSRLACALAAGETIAFGALDAAAWFGSKIGEAIYAEDLGAFSVYCCSGPTQVRRGTAATWTARAAVYGDVSPPFTYIFDWGEPGGDTTDDEGGVMMSLEHTYTAEPGSYTITLQVFDEAFTYATDNTHIPAFRTVTVVDPLQATCCAVDGSAKAGQPAQFSFTAAGGKKPLSFSLDMGDNRTIAGKTVRDLNLRDHVYAAAGTYPVTLTVTDADGERTTAVGSIVVQAAPSAACRDAKAHLCGNVRKVSCATSVMDNAIAKVRNGCGVAEADAFVAAAATYCGSSGDAFSVASCTALP